MDKTLSNNLKLLKAESKLVSATRLKLVKPLKSPAEIEQKFEADRKLITFALKKINPSFQMVANHDFEIDELAHVLTQIAEISERAAAKVKQQDKETRTREDLAAELAPTLLG